MHVVIISLLDILFDLFQITFDPFFRILFKATLRTHFHRRRQIDLQRGIWQHAGPDVAAVHDHIVLFSQFLLHPDQALTHLLILGRIRSCFAHFFRADGLADIFPVQIHHLDPVFILDLDIRFIADTSDCFFVFQVDPRPQAGKTQRPVHGTCVHVHAVKAFCQYLCNGAFSCSCRTVNRDLFHLFSFRGSFSCCPSC